MPFFFFFFVQLFQTHMDVFLLSSSMSNRSDIGCLTTAFSVLFTSSMNRIVHHIILFDFLKKINIRFDRIDQKMFVVTKQRNSRVIDQCNHFTNIEFFLSTIMAAQLTSKRASLLTDKRIDNHAQSYPPLDYSFHNAEKLEGRIIRCVGFFPPPTEFNHLCE